MQRRFGTLVLVLCLTAVCTGGCIGRMAVAGKVREFNLDAARSRWAREAIFVALYIVPAYPIAAVADLIFVNSVEFHSGINPVSGERRLARVGETREVEIEGGIRSSSTLLADGSIDVEIFGPGGVRHFVNVVERDGRLVSRDASGRELSAASR